MHETVGGEVVHAGGDLSDHVQLLGEREGRLYEAARLGADAEQEVFQIALKEKGRERLCSCAEMFSSAKTQTLHLGRTNN